MAGEHGLEENDFVMLVGADQSGNFVEIGGSAAVHTALRSSCHFVEVLVSCGPRWTKQASDLRSGETIARVFAVLSLPVERQAKAAANIFVVATQAPSEAAWS